MTAAILTRLPLEAGGAVLAVTGRAVHSAFSWTLTHYLRAPLASTGIAAMVTLSLVATSNALYFQHSPHPAPLFGDVVQTPGKVDPTIAPVVPAARPTKKPAVAALPKIATPKVEAKPAAATQSKPIGNTEVFELQRKLEAMKLFSGTVDGYYGPQTAGAIRAFEKQAGMKSTGQLTPEIITAVLAAPMLAAKPEPKVLPAPEPLPATDALPKAQTMMLPKVVPQPVAEPAAEPTPLPAPEPLQTVTVREVQPVAETRVLTRELPETPQEAMNIAADTAGDAIDTIINGVQSLAMTTPAKKAVPEPAAAPAAIEPLRVASTGTMVPATDPQVTASVAATPVVAPQATAQTELAMAPKEVPVLDTDAKVEDLMPPFSVTDPVIVARVQRGLASLGFLHGPIDGVAGEATAKAIRTFETFYNYERTGRITPELPDLLVNAGATL